jgi:hypothetical protein
MLTVSFFMDLKTVSIKVVVGVWEGVILLLFDPGYLIPECLIQVLDWHIQLAGVLLEVIIDCVPWSHIVLFVHALLLRQGTVKVCFIELLIVSVVDRPRWVGGFCLPPDLKLAQLLSVLELLKVLGRKAQVVIESRLALLLIWLCDDKSLFGTVWELVVALAQGIGSRLQTELLPLALNWEIPLIGGLIPC